MVRWMGTECEGRLADWLLVTDPTTWGSADPFDLVDGGKKGLTKALCGVTSDVKRFFQLMGRRTAPT